MIKVIYIILISILAIFAGCSKDSSSSNDPGWNNPGDKKEDELIVMCYNIRHCAPYYGTSETTTADVNSIAAVIKNKKPDIVFLQEVDKCTTRSLGIDQAKRIAELAGYPYYSFFKSQDYQGGEFGLAILSGISLKDAYAHQLPKVIDGVAISGDFVIGTAKIKRNGVDISLAVTHMPVEQADRDKLMPYVLKEIIAKQTTPIIFAGDFNATPTNNTMLRVKNDGFVYTNTDPANFTIPSNAPNREIDYICYKPSTDFKVQSHMVLRGISASDRLPLISILKIKNKQ